MYYCQDNRIKNAIEIIDNLPDNETNNLIKLYVQYQQEEILYKRQQLEEYRTWFASLDKFLPNRNPILG